MLFFILNVFLYFVLIVFGSIIFSIEICLMIWVEFIYLFKVINFDVNLGCIFFIFMIFFNFEMLSCVLGFVVIFII